MPALWERRFQERQSSASQVWAFQDFGLQSRSFNLPAVQAHPDVRGGQYVLPRGRLESVADMPDGWSQDRWADNELASDVNTLGEFCGRESP